MPYRKRLFGIALLCWSVWFYTACKEEIPAPAAMITTAVEEIPSDKISLGKYFFYDKRLSTAQKTACSTCHAPHFAFTDGYRRSFTPTMERTARNSSTLINSGAMQFFNWANPDLQRFEQQFRHPLFINIPLEMLEKAADSTLVLRRFQQDAVYQQAIRQLYPDNKDTLSWAMVFDALAAFCGSLSSYASPYDQFLQNGDSSVLSAAAWRGKSLFFSQRLQCATCHSGNNFSAATLAAADHNTAFANIGTAGADDAGVATKSGKPQDKGRFRIPTLRNLSFTSPYLHDGSAETLEAAIKAHQPLTRQPDLDKRLPAFVLTDAEQQSLAAFLYALNDSTVLNNPAFQKPSYLSQKDEQSY